MLGRSILMDEWYRSVVFLTSFIFFVNLFGDYGLFLYLCNIQFGEVGEPSGPTSLFLLEIESFYFKSFCAIDNTNYMA